jgi:DNA-binding NtrC family response regulator
MAARNRATRNVLVCEDDPVQLRLFTALFEQAGYRSLPARSPSEALSMARRWSVDAVVTDVRLEEGSGFDLVGDLRLIGLDAPIIMATAYATDGMRERARRAGVRAFLEKPLNLGQIRRHVDQAIVESGRRRPRAMIVESLDGVQSELQAAARRAGYAVLASTTGRLALDMLRVSSPAIDLLVMDVRAPEMSSADLNREAMRVRPGLAVAIVAGEATREEIRALYDAGAASFLRKPVGAERMEEFFRRSMAAARARQEREARRGKREERRAAAPWTEKLARGLRRFRHRAAAAVVAASLFAGVALSCALTWGFEKIDQMNKVVDAALPVAARAAAGSVEDRAFLRWHLLEQLQLTRQANETTRRYYDAHIQEMRWQKSAASASLPVAPEGGHSPDLSAGLLR